MVLCPACASAFAVGSTSSSGWGVLEKVKSFVGTPQGAMSEAEVFDLMRKPVPDTWQGRLDELTKLVDALKVNAQRLNKWTTVGRVRVQERANAHVNWLLQKMDDEGLVPGSTAEIRRRNSQIIEESRNVLASLQRG
eukprot:1306767-Rhodomonas_salina.1